MSRTGHNEASMRNGRPAYHFVGFPPTTASIPPLQDSQDAFAFKDANDLSTCPVLFGFRVDFWLLFAVFRPNATEE